MRGQNSNPSSMEIAHFFTSWSENKNKINQTLLQAMKSLPFECTLKKDVWIVVPFYSKTWLY